MRTTKKCLNSLLSEARKALQVRTSIEVMTRRKEAEQILCRLTGLDHLTLSPYRDNGWTINWTMGGTEPGTAICHYLPVTLNEWVSHPEVIAKRIVHLSERHLKKIPDSILNPGFSCTSRHLI